MNTRMYCGSKVDCRQAQEFRTGWEGCPTPEMVLKAELIELGEDDEVVVLTVNLQNPQDWPNSTMTLL